MQYLEESIDDHEQEILKIASILTQLLQPQQSMLQYICPEHVPDPKHTLQSILQEQIPYQKQVQQPMILLLTYCFYTLLSLHPHTQQTLQIQQCFQQYLALSTFLPKRVRFLEASRKLVTKLCQNRDLIEAKKGFESLMQEMRGQADACLEILNWRVWLSVMVIRSMLKLKDIKRDQVVKLIKKYKQLKDQRKVPTTATANAFAFLLEQFMLNHNDLYIYFELELKQMLKQTEQSAYQIIYHALNNFQNRHSNFIQRSNIPNSQLLALISTPPAPIPSTHTIHRRLKQNTARIEAADQAIANLKSGGKTITTFRGDKSLASFRSEDKTLRRIDHLMKFRKSAIKREAHQTGQRVPAQELGTRQKISLHQTTRLGWFKGADKPVEAQRSNSRCGSLLNKRKKRAQLYKSIAEKSSEGTAIKGQNLSDEMNEIEQITALKCRISLEEILLGQQKDENYPKTHQDKRLGASLDVDFSTLKLTLLAIFNQEMAYLHISIHKSSNSYLPHCIVRSTFCQHQNSLRYEPVSPKKEFTLQDLKYEVEESVIYFQALQERMERKVTNKEKEVLEELVHEQLGLTLSEMQLLKVILAVDLVRSDFFWYFTKSSFVNGSRIERRHLIKFEDKSAFAVCMSKFKSDYDSCLRQLIEVQNIQSLTETCLYLSHGRLIVYRQLVNIKSAYYLQVLTISKLVYASFKRIKKVPYFECTRLERSFVDLQRGVQVKGLGQTEIDLREVVEEAEVFVFFMKNIVENFIELKYYFKIATFLHNLNASYNQEYLYELQFKPVFQQSPLQQNQSEGSSQLLEQKPPLHPSIANMRYLILSYVQAYELSPKLSITRTLSHILCFNGKRYFVDQTQLKNGIRIYKLFKFTSRATYHLMIAHNDSQNLHIVPAYPYNRLATKRTHRLFCNLVRKEKPQPYCAMDETPLKFISLISGHYAFIALWQSLTYYRLDLYLPRLQIRLATYIDECYERSLPCSAWRQLLREARLDLERRMLRVDGRQFKMYELLKQMQFGTDTYDGNIQLIDYDKKIHYIVTNNRAMCLELGTVDEIPFAYSRAALKSLNSHKIKHSLYDSLITRLYCQIQTGKLASDVIEPAFFQIV